MNAFSLNEVLRQLRAGPPSLTAVEASALARTSGWRFVGERTLEIAIELSLQTDEEEGWTSFRSGKRADVRSALGTQLGHFPKHEEQLAGLSDSELKPIYRLWKERLRLPAELLEELETDVPSVLAAAQIVAQDAPPGVAFHRKLWEVYVSGLMPIGWPDWPNGQLIVGYFG